MKFLVLGVLAIASLPALATKARLIALGEEVTGSQYINDNRNVFLNSAYANYYGNAVFLELGANGKTSAAVKQDVDNEAQSEGGVFTKHNNMVYGLYVGAESAQTFEARSYLNVGTSKVHQNNQLDAFVAGDIGSIKWGLNGTYTGTKNDTGDIKQNSGAVRLGVIADKLEAFANVSLVNSFKGDVNSTGTTGKEKFDGNLGFELGATYHLPENLKAFGFWRHAGWKQQSDEAIAAGGTYVASSGSMSKAKITTDKFILGLGREAKLNAKTTLFTKLSYQWNDRKLKTDVDGNAKINDGYIPVVIGLEHDATEWMTLRGSITHNLWGQDNHDYDSGLLQTGVLSTAITGTYPDGKRTRLNSTNVNAGVTFKFGDFSVDGLLGLGTGTSANETGILTTDNLMSRLAMTYRW